jgi:putative phage-type endonuclease
MSIIDMFKPMSDIEVEKMMIELEEEDNLAQKLYQEMDSDVKNELIEYTLEILNELYSQNINLLHDEGYDDFINSNVKEMVKVQISCIQEYNDPFDGMDENIKVIIPEFIISDAERVFYTHVAPRRSYDTTFIRIKPNISQIENKIEHLKNKPQPEQRTKEWYEKRHNMITASSAGAIFDTQSSKNRLIYEKCKPFSLGKQSAGGALGWGIKYEPVSVMFYENMYSLKVTDFGCIEHDKYTFIGASPDGIVTSQSSNRYGRMLEIKNPISRNITGSPKKEYWIQMQLQMEVCNLNECDFLETKFVEYANEEDFRNDGTFCSTSLGQLKGIILKFLINNEIIHEYLQIYSSEDEYRNFKQCLLNKYGADTYQGDTYYKLEYYSCILVLRNKDWVKYALPIMKEIWDTIEKERISGYQHRAPKQKKKKTTGCLVDMKDFGNKEQQEEITEMFNTTTPPRLQIRTESIDETLRTIESDIKD